MAVLSIKDGGRRLEERCIKVSMEESGYSRRQVSELNHYQINILRLRQNYNNKLLITNI